MGYVNFTDGLLLLLPTNAGMKEMLVICSENSASYEVLFDASMSKLATFGPCSSSPDFPFMNTTDDIVQREERQGSPPGNVLQHDKILDFGNEIL